MINRIIEQGKRLAGRSATTKVETVLHPGGRGERGFVTFFLYDKGQSFCLAKVPRVDNALARREADNLELVRGVLQASPLRDSVDRVLGVVEIGGKLVLFKPCIPGRPLSQLLARAERGDVLQGLRASTSWLLQFIRDTSGKHVIDAAMKRRAAESIVSPDHDQSWVEAFVSSDYHVLGPSHGDLVPANILYARNEVAGIVDFENFDATGFPYADFVGLIVSIATTVFGRDHEMIDMTFRNKTWFSNGVAEQVALYCRQTGCTVNEFVDVLPMYSDRAISIASAWNLPRERVFHETLRAYFVSERSALAARYGACR